MARRTDQNDPYARQALLDELSGTDPFTNPPSDQAMPGPTDTETGGQTNSTDNPWYDPNGTGGVTGNTTPPPVVPAQTASVSSPLEGFDAGKLADPTHTSPKYVFARIAQQYNIKDPSQREAMLQALRADPSGYFANATLNGDILDVGANPNSAFDGYTQFDVFRDFDNAQGPQAAVWQPLGAGGSTQTQGGYAPPAGYIDNIQDTVKVDANGNPIPNGTTGITSGTTLNSGLNDLVRSQLEKWLAYDPNTVSIDDPALANTAEAYRRGQERTVADRRAASAERLAAQGLGSSGALDASVERGIQDAGNASSEYNANLVLSERDKQVAQLQNYLSQAAGILSRDQETLLRQKLMELQNQQYYDNLGYQIGATDASLNNQLISLLLSSGYSL
jgi:hypothetical protein